MTGHVGRIDGAIATIKRFGLTGDAAALAFYIAHRDGAERGCFAPVNTMAEDFGWSQSRVKRARARLIESRAVTHERAGRKPAVLRLAGSPLEPTNDPPPVRIEPSPAHTSGPSPARQLSPLNKKEPEGTTLPPAPASGGAVPLVAPEKPAGGRRRNDDRYRAAMTEWVAEHFPGADPAAVSGTVSAMPPHIERTSVNVRKFAEGRGPAWTPTLAPAGRSVAT